MSRPTTPAPATSADYRSDRFRLFPFRSPLLRESRFLSLPRATKMFQFARLPPLRLWIQREGTRALPRVGFPIRKSPDQRLLGSSPRLIAAIHVLHRLLVPRHSPCALVLLIRRLTVIREHHFYRYAVFKVPRACGPLERPDGSAAEGAAAWLPDASDSARSLKTQQHEAPSPRSRASGRRQTRVDISSRRVLLQTDGSSKRRNTSRMEAASCSQGRLR